jgi:hypothetical protein
MLHLLHVCALQDSGARGFIPASLMFLGNAVHASITGISAAL